MFTALAEDESAVTHTQSGTKGRNFIEVDDVHKDNVNFKRKYCERVFMALEVLETCF